MTEPKSKWNVPLIPTSFLSCWVYTTLCSESTTQAAWVWELSSLRKKPKENVLSHFCPYLIRPLSSGFPFETYCLWGAVFLNLFFGSGGVGRGGKTLFLSRPGFDLQSRRWRLPLCHRGHRVALGVPGPRRRRGPTSCPGARGAVHRPRCWSRSAGGGGGVSRLALFSLAVRGLQCTCVLRGVCISLPVQGEAVGRK